MGRGRFPLALLFCMLPLFFCYGQLDGGIFEQITTSQGLSSNKVNKILQDREGFYWIATADGLNRFDGSSFKIFRNEKANAYSLVHNFCKSLLEDIYGNIWVGTYKGISVYHKKENLFQTIILQPDTTYPQLLNKVFDMTQDDNGNIWISCYGLWRYNIHTNRLTKFRHESNDPSSISDNSETANIFFDKTHNGIWIQTAGGVNFFDIASGEFYNHSHNPRLWKIFTISITIFTKDINDNIWCVDDAGGIDYINISKNEVSVANFKNRHGINFLTTDDSIRLWISYWEAKSLIYDHRSKSVDTVFFRRQNSKSALSENFTSLFIDKNRNYWFCSVHGISIYRHQRQFYKLYELPVPFREVDARYITSVVPSDHHSLWVGSAKGLYEFDLQTLDYKKVHLGLQDDFIRTIYRENDSILWLGNRYWLHQFDSKKKRIINSLLLRGKPQRIQQDRDQNLWIATWSSGLYEISNKGKILNYFTHNDRITGSLPYDGLICANIINGQLWLGLNGGYGFAKYDAGQKCFHRYRPVGEDSFAVQPESVNVIIANDDNSFWLGTHGGGVYLWDQSKDQYRHFTQNDGLSGNFINSIYKDRLGRTWVSTSNGLNFLDTASQKFVPLNIDFTFPTDDFFQNFVCANNNRLIFFCVNKIVEIDAEQYESTRQNYPIVVSGYKIFDQEKTFTADDSIIRLTHNQNFFSFEFSALRTNPEEAVQYAYQLEGFDKDWNYSGARHFATYTNVPGGKYKFKIKATNEQGEWNEHSKAVTIVISPPFWKTAWFISLMSALIMLVLITLYRFRIRQLRRMYSLRSKISQDLHDEVASTLSGIRLYSELAKQQLQKQDMSKVHHSLEVISVNASEMKEDMSDIIWAINPGNDSLGRLLQKLRLYANELTKAANMRFEMKIDENLPEEKLNMEQRRNIYLICKEAIHNAVKYSKAIELQMDVLKKDHSMHILISDNGRGFQPDSTSMGNGLINMRARAKEIGAHLTVDSGNGNGTAVELKMKI